MSTDRPTEILAAWDEVTRSAQAPHQPARPRSRVAFPAGALVLGSVVLALVLALPLLQGTSPRGGGALSSGSPVAQTDASATDGPASAPIVTCSEVSAEGCTAAVALVHHAYPDEFARTSRVVVADTCPPRWVCDRAFPFDAYVVLVAPDGAPVRAVQVVGSNGPERIYGPAPSPLPPHVLDLIVQVAGSATPDATPVVESDCPGGSVGFGSPPETPEFLAVVRAVNRDPDNFDSIYVDPTGIVVIEYVGDNAGRPAVEEKIPAGMQVRWQEVRYSRAELRRIQDEIMERHLAGVYGTGSGNACNAVTVLVDEGSIDEIRRLLADAYGDAVQVIVSGPVIAW